MTLPTLPEIKISFDHARRCWTLTGPALPSPILFAASGRGAAGLVGAPGMAVFAPSGHRREDRSRLCGEALHFWFDGDGGNQLIR